MEWMDGDETGGSIRQAGCGQYTTYTVQSASRDAPGRRRRRYSKVCWWLLHHCHQAWFQCRITILGHKKKSRHRKRGKEGHLVFLVGSTALFSLRLVYSKDLSDTQDCNNLVRNKWNEKREESTGSILQPKQQPAALQPAAPTARAKERKRETTGRKRRQRRREQYSKTSQPSRRIIFNENVLGERHVRCSRRRRVGGAAKEIRKSKRKTFRIELGRAQTKIKRLLHNSLRVESFPPLERERESESITTVTNMVSSDLGWDTHITTTHVIRRWHYAH